MAAAALLGCGWAVTADQGQPQSLVVDEASLQLVRERLSPLRSELDELVAPAASKAASPARIRGCRTDSGELLQPELVKGWTLDDRAASSDALVARPAALQAHAALVQQLVAAGWLNDGTPEPGITQALLHKDVGGYTLSITVHTFLDQLAVSAFAPPENVCSRPPAA